MLVAASCAGQVTIVEPGATGGTSASHASGSSALSTSSGGAGGSASTGANGGTGGIDGAPCMPSVVCGCNASYDAVCATHGMSNEGYDCPNLLAVPVDCIYEGGPTSPTGTAWCCNGNDFGGWLPFAPEAGTPGAAVPAGCVDDPGMDWACAAQGKPAHGAQCPSFAPTAPPAGCVGSPYDGAGCGVAERPGRFCCP